MELIFLSSCWVISKQRLFLISLIQCKTSNSLNINTRLFHLNEMYLASPQNIPNNIQNEFRNCILVFG